MFLSIFIFSIYIVLDKTSNLYPWVLGMKIQFLWMLWNFILVEQRSKAPKILNQLWNEMKNQLSETLRKCHRPTIHWRISVIYNVSASVVSIVHNRRLWGKKSQRHTVLHTQTQTQMDCVDYGNSIWDKTKLLFSPTSCEEKAESLVSAVRLEACVEGAGGI